MKKKRLLKKNIAGNYDVVVCGAGPAGIAAALAAARGGAKTLLVEKQLSVGGIGTGAFIPTWGDTQQGWAANELEKRLVQLKAAERKFDPARYLYQNGRLRFHGETMKAVGLKFLREMEVEILLDTVAESAWCQGRTVKGVYIANKGGRQLVKARAIIDATADADIAATAGAAFLKGDPQDGRLQHVNFKFQTTGIDWQKFARNKPAKKKMLAMIRQARSTGELHPPPGVFNPPEATFPYQEKEDALLLGKWEISGVDSSDPWAVSRTLVACQIAALEAIEFCRKKLPGFAKAKIERFPAMLGTRESRRVIGKYVLTKADVLSGKKFDDGVTEACFFMDFHDSPPGTTIPYTLEEKKAGSPVSGDWYEIPYRCLVPEKTKGLLMAGRCISADRAAHAALRIQPTCMFIGEAAGTAAALAVKLGILPHELDGRRVRAKMAKDNIFSR